MVVFFLSVVVKKGSVLAAGGPVQTEVVALIHFLMGGDFAVAAEILDQFGHLQIAAVVFQHRDGAHRQLVAVVELDLDRRLARDFDRHDAIGGGPVRHALVDEGVDQHPFDLVEVGTVEIHVFAAADRTGAVVGVELDVGRAFIGAPGVAQRLHRALGAVAHLEQTAQVEVDAGLGLDLGCGRFAEQLAEEATRFLLAGVGHRVLVPVQVDADAAIALAVALVERDLVATFFKPDF